MSKTNTTTEAEVLEALTAVFLEHGFGGATLSLFTEATGLKRPSLYHRFPGGKLDMAVAVVEFGQERFFGEVLGPLLREEEGDARQRIEETAQNMARFYDEVGASCLMDAVSLGAKGEDRQAIDKLVLEMFARFFGVMAKAAKDLGAGDDDAARLGEEAVIRLEGSLVVARGTGDASAFKRTLKHLPDLLAGASNPAQEATTTTND